MRYSTLVGKTKKEAPKDEVSRNAQLLIRAGFIQKEMAGVYAFLPLGLRVLDKVVNIIRQEMDVIGGQEMHLGALQNPETWQKTDRWSDEVIDVWFKTKLANGTEVGLGSTHEEPLTQIMTQQVQSYKDLPMYPYQFQSKFRNELRAKSGLLRTREFLMKDMYSFNKDLEEQELFYEKAAEAYHKVFERLNIGNETFYTFASGGAFAKFSHEFQTVCENGEDTIYLDEEKRLAINKEVYTDEVIELLELDRANLKEVSAIEVGNIFKLGTRFSEPLGLSYTDEQGEETPVVMGSYGIGPARCMATVVELHNDEKGIAWPEAIAPFRIHLVVLNADDESTLAQAEKAYKGLVDSGVEVLIDERIDASAGQKFADADLIGCPYRAVISKRTGAQVELKARNSEETKLVDIETLKTL